MKCYYCKRIIADGSAFCPHCGQPQTVGADLLQAARMGDQEALTDLYNRTSTGVYNTIRFIVKDEDSVLDIMQDTYIKAFDSLDQLQEASKFEPWIKRIAHNKAIDYLHRSKPLIFSEMVPEDSDEVLQFEDVRPDVQPAEVADQKETARLIKQILDSLAAMVAEKVYKEHMMEDDPRFHARYQVMVGQIHEEGPFVQIARTVGQYTWYDIEGNSFFWAEPEFRMTESSQPGLGKAGYQRSVDLARQMAGQAA